MDFAVGDKFLREGEAKNCARACSMRASVQRFRANKDTRETRVWWIASDTRLARLTPSTLAKGKSHEQHRLPRRRSRHRCRYPVLFRLALSV